MSMSAVDVPPSPATPPKLPAARPASGDVYRWLMAGFQQSGCTSFDAHVIACVLALAVEEAAQGVPLTGALGLAPAALASLVGELFPHALQLFSGLDPSLMSERSEEEAQLCDLLVRGTTTHDRLELWLAQIIARRAQRPNHLWQDLGLRTRNELGWLMERHFEPLALRNVRGMRWKKFLYRMICRDTGYTLCTAPSCTECCDFDTCFGDESGESLLAAQRRKQEQT
jgi:nitrogen fixation protein NifQ